MEKWKNVNGFENYIVSTEGRVKNLDTGNYVGNKFRDTYGYAKVKLCYHGKKKQIDVHRLVAETFIPNPLNKQTVNHINGIKSDNRVENLEWATYSENSKHAHKTGLQICRKGELAGNAKLKNEDVDYIRKIYKPYSKAFGCRALSQEFCVSERTIRNYISGRNYAI